MKMLIDPLPVADQVVVAQVDRAAESHAQSQASRFPHVDGGSLGYTEKEYPGSSHPRHAPATSVVPYAAQSRPDDG